MAPLPKRHHYVPEFLLNNFRAQDNLVRLFDKKDAASGVVARNPTKVLFEPHLYTRTHNDGHRDAQLEAAYGRLEDASAPIVKRIVDSARAKRLPQLSAWEKAVWDQFLYNQWRRVPELHATLFTREFFDKLREDAVASFERNYRSINDQERAWLRMTRNWSA
ncbi:MAG: hypothetical protein K0R85_181 [Devosia sp.]|nr:hypothetical protein [Devosia sp.]